MAPVVCDTVTETMPQLGRDRAPAVVADTLLEPLNREQRAAVEALDGPVLVLAGAGTGKTRALTVRLARILTGGHAAPGQVLAVTFTNKAAREMSERVARLIGRPTEGMWLGTFHAMGARLLRRHAELAGLRSNFSIIDRDDQIRLLKDIIEAHAIDEKRWPARMLAAIVARWKDKGWMPDKVPESQCGDFAHGKAVELYRDYQERLAALNGVDFGDLLLLNLEVFLAHREVLEDYHRRFRYILVDEYQDTNIAQYLWLRLLAQGNRNICCVGDDDQSIYGWRGAEIGNILRFEDDFPGARIIRLERNYRSTPHILGAASGLIAHNRGRLGKTLWTPEEDADSPPVRLQGVWDDAEEARAVSDEIEALQRRGERLDGTAILVRVGAQTRAFEERLVTIGLPYRVIGGLRFYERQEIRDAIAYLRLVRQGDDDLAFRRIVNTPKRGLGDRSLQTLHALARARGLSLLASAERLADSDELPAGRRSALRRFGEQLARWRAESSRLEPAALAELVLEESGYTAMWLADKSLQAQGRLENLKELVRAMAEFESLEGFLDHVGLVMDHETGDAGDDMVNVMTLHGAKGLEFETVFLPGWEEGVFPNQRALDEQGNAGLEEERRLAYVGLTRARKRAHVLHAANRRMHGRWQNNTPSRFVEELPAEHVERLEAAGYGLAEPGRMPWRPAPSWMPQDSRRGHYRRVIEARRQFHDGREVYVPLGQGEDVPEVGCRIFHQKFGYGRVKGVDGDKLDIAFEKAGSKRVIASFVERV